jgi:glycosyltransferase involved in cell wall biosynthesis
MNVMVSVLVTAYNKGKYIRQALESVMQQKTNFPIEVIIGEDCSTDGTRAIVKEYEEKYPAIIKPVYLKSNVGVVRNTFEICFPRLTGKYVALLDGDDYWIDPLKLQKQVDFLEANPDFALCWHSHIEVTNKGVEEPFKDELHRDVSTIEDICEYSFIPVASVVFRNHLIKKFPDWIYTKGIYQDWPLFVLLAEQGKIKRLPGYMSFYRTNGEGAYSGLPELKRRKKNIRMMKLMNAHFMGKYQKHFHRHWGWDANLIFYWDSFLYFSQKRQFLKACYYAFKVITTLKFSRKNPYTITRMGTIKQLMLTLFVPKKDELLI